MTTLRSIHLATRTPCAGRVVPAGLAGLERRPAYALAAIAGWSGLGTGNQAEGFGLCSKDMTREVLPT